MSEMKSYVKTCVNALKASSMDMNTTHLMNLLKISAKMRYTHKGKSVQAHLFKLGHQNTLSLQNQLLNVYLKCNEFRYAFKVFDEMPVRNIITYNTLLCGCADFGSNFESIIEKGFRYFKKMLVKNGEITLDRITFTSLIKMSITFDDILIGKQLHCSIIKLGLCIDCYISSSLIDFYSKFNSIRYAKLVFELCIYRDLVVWNGMISCYASNSLAKETFSLFDSMRKEAIKGDAFTFCNLLKASISKYFEFGKQIHSFAVRLSFGADVAVATTLVDMYAKNEEIANARKIFDSMVYKNIITWNAIIVGYGINKEGEKAMKILKKMFRQKTYPNELTLSGVLSSHDECSSLVEITQIHCYAIKHDFYSFVSVANSLINAYSKCGFVDLGFNIFTSINFPDIVTYSSMIKAYAYNSLPEKSIELFEKMILNNILPDRVSFLGVLSACSHGGLINEGIYYFNLMTKFYRIIPSLEHYTCIVDLFSRFGLLNEAFTFMSLMKCEPGEDMVGAFIGACLVYRNSKRAKWAEDKISKIETNDSVNYTLLSNLYACDGNWVDVERVRETMTEKCGYISSGCTWIEIHK